MATHSDDVPHTQDCDPDNCMRERLRYMRGQGGANFQFRYGKDRFHGPTIKERQDHALASAAREGKSIRVVNPTYDRAAKF